MRQRIGLPFKEFDLIRFAADGNRNFIPVDIQRDTWDRTHRRTKVEITADKKEAAVKFLAAKEEESLAPSVAAAVAAPAPDPGPAIILHEPAPAAASAEEIVDAFLAKLEVLTAENDRLMVENEGRTIENAERLERAENR